MTKHTQGFDKLDRQLAALTQGFADEELRGALRAGGEIIAEEARRLAPVDTGTLKNSITVMDDRDARIYGKVNLPAMSVYVGPVGSTDDGDVYYAKFQEFGTIRNAAQPFMRPAIASKRPEAERLIVDTLRADLARRLR